MGLTLENVAYTYRNSGAQAVKSAKCEFESGHIYAIMGPSGSGKSTLLSMLAGLDLPTTGDVLFEDKKLRGMDLDKYRREDISMIFQAFQLFPLLNVIENVCYPMELAGREKALQKKAKDLLTRVGITAEKHKRYPANLSGGEQQRVAIARSLSSGAEVLLADEPTGNLDLENSEAVIGILKNLARNDGYCVIVVTHDSDIAAQADVMFKMQDGVLTAWD